MTKHNTLMDTIIDDLLSNPDLTLDDIKKKNNVNSKLLLSYIEHIYKNRNKYYDIKYRISPRYETDLKVKKAFEEFLQSDKSLKKIFSSFGINEQSALKRLQDNIFTSKNLKLVIEVSRKLRDTGLVGISTIDLATKTVLKYYNPRAKFSVFSVIQKGTENIYLDLQEILSDEMYDRFLIADKTKRARMLELNKACFRATYNNTTIEEELEQTPSKPNTDDIDYGFLRFCSPCLIKVLKDCKKNNSIKPSPLLQTILNKTATKSEWDRLDKKYGKLEPIDSDNYYNINLTR